MFNYAFFCLHTYYYALVKQGPTMQSFVTRNLRYLLQVPAAKQGKTQTSFVLDSGRNKTDQKTQC